jgi:hypothetical protein
MVTTAPPPHQPAVNANRTPTTLGCLPAKLTMGELAVTSMPPTASVSYGKNKLLKY